MKIFKILLSFSVLMCSITSCMSQKFEKEAPVTIDQIYTQHWNSGVKFGGSGLNIFVTLKAELPKDITLDSIYFDSYQLTLQQDTHNALLFVGRYTQEPKNNGPVSVTNPIKTDPKKSSSKPKFQLENNECVIRYTVLGTTKYFKYDGLFEKQAPLIPQSRP